MYGSGFLRLMRMAWGFRESKILLTANDLDLFSLLSNGISSAETLAQHLQVDARALEIVMDALVAMGILAKDNNNYRNQELAENYLVKKNPNYRGQFLKHLHMQWNQWNNLAEILKTGHNSLQFHASNQENHQFNQAFIRGMDNMGQERANRILQVLDLNGAHQMLDLGGGAATYAIAFARSNPELRCVVLDLPLPLEVARENIESNRLSERIKTLEGSYWEVDFGIGYDLIWISQIIHSLDESRCMKLIGKAADALSSGGRLIVHDSLLNEGRTSPYFASLFSVFMLSVTEKGRCYTANEVQNWLGLAGLKDVHHIELDAESEMAIGIKP